MKAMATCSTSQCLEPAVYRAATYAELYRCAMHAREAYRFRQTYANHPNFWSIVGHNWPLGARLTDAGHCTPSGVGVQPFQRVVT